MDIAGFRAYALTVARKHIIQAHSESSLITIGKKTSFRADMKKSESISGLNVVPNAERRWTVKRMTFDWLSAFQVLVCLGIPTTVFSAIFMVTEGYDDWAIALFITFFVLAFIAGGIPWEVAKCG
jgi:cytochrome bd-type quinol oxidase subunit 1